MTTISENQLTLYFGSLRNNQCDVWTPTSEGYVSGRFDFPFEVAEYEKITGNRYFLNPDQEGLHSNMEKVGLWLFRELFSDKIKAVYQTKGPELRLRLVFSPENADAIRLYHLPWECLFDPDSDRFWLDESGRSLSRLLMTGRDSKLRPWPKKKPWRVLAVAASPKKHVNFEKVEPLDIDSHWRAIEPTQKGPNPTRIRFTRSGDRTFESFKTSLLLAREQGNPYQGVHFFLHGYSYGGWGVLLFENSERGAEPIKAGDLADIFRQCPELCFVTLASCQTARFENPDRPFRGIATALLKAGVPHVVAMSRDISQENLDRFFRGFYGRLAVDGRLEESVAMGRRCIDGATQQDRAEWAVPVLFSRLTERAFAEVNWPFFRKLWSVSGLLLFYLTLIYTALGQSGDLKATLPIVEKHYHAAAIFGLIFCGPLYLAFAVMTLFHIRRHLTASWHARIPSFWNVGWNWAHSSTKWYQAVVLFFFLVLPTYGQAYFLVRFFDANRIEYCPSGCPKKYAVEPIPIRNWYDHFDYDYLMRDQYNLWRVLFENPHVYRYSDGPNRVTFFPIWQPAYNLVIVSVNLVLFLLIVYWVFWAEPPPVAVGFDPAHERRLM